MNSVMITKMNSGWRKKSIIHLAAMMGIILSTILWAGLQASRGDISTSSLMIVFFSFLAVSPIIFKGAMVLFFICSDKDRINIIEERIVVIDSKIMSISISEIKNIYLDHKGPNIVLDCGDRNERIWAQFWQDCPVELEKKLRIATGLH